MATYANVLAEVKKLSAEDQLKLIKDIKKAQKAPAEGAEAKPKRVLTEEQKAKMKAGREAAKARKLAEAGGAAGGAPAPAPEPKAEKPKRVLTDEMKAKMKAGREAAKAKKAGGAAGGGAAVAAGPPALGPMAAGPLDFEENEDEEPMPVVLVNWDHDFGLGMKTYKRLDHEGMAYIYTQDREYLGAYIEKTKKLKKSVADPLKND